MLITQEVKDDLKLLIELNLATWCQYLETPNDDSDEDEISCGTLTIGLNDEGDEWSYQTGDNSFTGGAYSFPHWSVVYFTAGTTPGELLADLIRDIHHMDY